jgi:large subunit ribosomal protein L11
MAKKIETLIKVQAKGGQATPAPPIGPALGPKGVNAADFCKRFNDATRDRMGQLLPCIITVYSDRTYDFIIKTPPASQLLLMAANIKLGSAEPNRKKVGKVTWAQIREIAEKKMVDLNCFDIDAAMSMIAGTARSMGIVVEGKSPIEKQ